MEIGGAMNTTYTTPTYSTLLDHRGRALAVVPEPCRLVDGVALVLEDLSTPWECEGVMTFEARFTGPAGRPLQSDFYRLSNGDDVFVLHLEVVATDLRFVHYEAVLTERVSHGAGALAS
jgi:hypothetical protein